MGTHPIFESDFDCLTEMENNEDKDLEPQGGAVEQESSSPQQQDHMTSSEKDDEMKSDSEENSATRGNSESNPSSPQEEITDQPNIPKPDDPHSPITEASTTEDIGEEMSEAQKRVSESPVSVAASDSSSTRPNKRKRKGTAPTRHVQPAEGSQNGNESKPNGTENEENETEDNSDSEFDKAYNEIDKANNRKLLEEFETKSEIVSRPDSINEPMGLAASQSRPQKYGPPRLDLFGPPQHYLDLFGPPVRESTDNCSVVIRGIGEEEIYCGPGDKDPGDTMIPLRTHSNF